MSLAHEINTVLHHCPTPAVSRAYRTRLKAGKLVRDENIHSHVCAYFVPNNPITKQVLIGDHKKSGLWLMPGGHVDAGQTLLETLNREIEEGLGVPEFFATIPEPFLLSITHIVTDVRPCREHFDIWFLMETDGADFQIDYTEYHSVQWVTIPEARQTLLIQLIFLRSVAWRRCRK